MSYVFAMFAIMVFLTTIVTLGSQNTFSAFAITQMPSVSITSPSNNTIVSAGNVTMTYDVLQGNVVAVLQSTTELN